MPGTSSLFSTRYLPAGLLRECIYLKYRHDIDGGHPRTPAEIYESNRMVAQRMEGIFQSRGVPVVPSLGDFRFSLTSLGVNP